MIASGCAGLALFSQKSVSAADNTGVISGVVTSAKGPEAGVWVIAETDGLQTKFRKIVVTNDQGKYLLPELPKAASYNIWVRGYGLDRFEAGSGQAGPDAEPDGGDRQERRGKRRKSIPPTTGPR